MEQDTKLKVLMAAAELISSRGYHNVSVREICESAGVTKPVLYYYFNDKENLLANLIEEGQIRFKELFDKNIDPDSNFIDSINGLFNIYVDYTETYPYLIKISVHVQLSPLPEKIKILSRKKAMEVSELITSIFKKGIEEKYFDEKVEIEMLVNSLLAPLGMFIAQSVLFKENTAPLKDTLKKYFDFWNSHFLKKEN